jgi:phospholipid-translocating ATPase
MPPNPLFPIKNQSPPRTKTGLLDLEINRLAKVLFAIMVALSFVLIAFKGFTGNFDRKNDILKVIK